MQLAIGDADARWDSVGAAGSSVRWSDRLSVNTCGLSYSEDIPIADMSDLRGRQTQQCLRSAGRDDELDLDLVRPKYFDNGSKIAPH